MAVDALLSFFIEYYVEVKNKFSLTFISLIAFLFCPHLQSLSVLNTKFAYKRPYKIIMRYQ